MIRDFGQISGRCIIAGRSIHFRSKLERRWAKVLQLCKSFPELSQVILNDVLLDWQYEPRAFMFDDPDAFEVATKPKTRGILQYTPDFLLTLSQGELWHETKKTYLDSEDCTKLRAFKKYYPSQQLTTVIDGLPKGNTVNSRLKLHTFDLLKMLGYGLLDARPVFRSLAGWMNKMGVEL